MKLFGRPDATPAADEPVATEDATAATKGKRTPTRKEAEAARKARARGVQNKAKDREDARRKRVEQRAQAAAGVESALPARDRGPARRYARDLVDGRRSVGEYFLYIAMAVILLGFVRIPAVQTASLLLLFGLVGALVLDGLITHKFVKRAVTAKFGAEAAQGAGGYAVMRAMTMRRTRMPAPQVRPKRLFRRGPKDDAQS